MEFIRRSWAQIRAYLAGLTFSERALVGMSLVVLIVVLTWILPYLVSPATEKVPNFAGEHQPEAVQRLQAAGIKATVVNGDLMVPAGKTEEALSILAQNDLLAADITAAFDEYVKRYSPLVSNSQSKLQFQMAKEKVLSALVSRMAGVKAATVMVSMPEESGFGHNAPKPTASVTVFMKTRGAVDKPLVAAIAGLVAGANSPMKSQDVTVVDAVNGRSLNVGTDDLLPATALEQIRANEEHYRSIIETSLAYIKGRVVSVTVQIDPTIQSDSNKYVYNKTEPLLTQEEKSSKRTENTATGGEPGTRSNAGTDLTASTGNGSTSEETTSRSTFAAKELTETTHTVGVGLMPKQVNVNVGVPRSYFVDLFKVGKPADKATDPDEAALTPVIAAQLAEIEGQVRNLIPVDKDNKAAVKAYVMNTDIMAGSGLIPPSTGSGLAMALDSTWARPAGLAMLALVSLGLMFGMVRKATRQQPMPTVQELAGVPPTLPTDDDLVGEADETDPSMAGVELDEDELRTRKIAQQIGEMVKTNPAEAASLVRRWVRTEE